MIYTNDSYQMREFDMDTARLFQVGRSQAVNLPKEYRFEGQRVAIKRLGSGVLLFPISEPWQLIEQALEMFESDTRLVGEQPQVQTRPEIAP